MVSYDTSIFLSMGWDKRIFVFSLVAMFIVGDLRVNAPVTNDPVGMLANALPGAGHTLPHCESAMYCRTAPLK